MEPKKLTGYPSIDKPWLKYYSEEAINTPLPECTIYEYLWENNKDHLNDIAIWYINHKITYKELFEKIDQCAKAFIALGVTPGEIVTLAMPSIPEALYAVYALNKIGAVANMIHPLAGQQETVNYLNEVQSRIFLMFTGTWEIVKTALKDTSVETAVVVSPAESLAFPMKQLYRLKTHEPSLEGITGLLSWRDFIQQGSSTVLHDIQKDPNEAALISHTGGTTGDPKGVVSSDRNLTALMYQIACNFHYNRQGRSLVVLPLFVNYSLVEAMMGMLVIGYQVILIPKYEPEKLSEYIDQYRPTIILSIPAYWEALLTAKDKKRRDFSSLEQIYYGGEGMSGVTERRINQVLKAHKSNVELLKGLGSTELGACATLSYPDCNPEDSVGVPLVHLNCKIVDPETGVELSYNKNGEICFSGPTLMLGYYNKPEATDEVVIVHADGQRWFHTGDIGYITEDGVIFVTGRIKRIIMTRDKDAQVTKMFPGRIEKALYAHPAVNLCCVVGVSDKERINYPKAFVVLKDGCAESQKLTQEILSVCRNSLPDYMVPEEIEYRVDLPRTPRGKIDYRALEKEAEKV